MNTIGRVGGGGRDKKGGYWGGLNKDTNGREFLTKNILNTNNVVLL